MLYLYNLEKKVNNSISYIDTHSGNGIYKYISKYMDKNKEYKEGIKKIQNYKGNNILIKNYLSTISKITGKNNFYPGSPIFISYIANEKDKLFFCELHNNEYKLLKKNLNKYTNAKILNADGFNFIFNKFSDLVVQKITELKKEFNLTFIFISHDLSIVEAFCNSVSVLYYGEVVEQSSAKKIFRYPRHPYTELLVKSVPTLLSDIQITDNGQTPNLFEEQKGCLFSSRCNYSRSTCFKKDIKLESLGESYVRCNFPIKKNSKQKKKRIKSTNGGGRVY